MCLDHSAHGVAPNHAIFQGPFPVAMEFKENPTPPSYAHYYSGRALGKTIPAWRVEKVGYTEDAADSTPGVEVGVVAGGWGFDDSPDAEVIAGGLNSKAMQSVALGRQGPFFHWGFGASPSNMTESGRAAFLNAVCYIEGFDGAPVLVRNEKRGRETAIDSAWRLTHLEAGYLESVAWHQERAKKHAAAKEAAKTRELTDDEAFALEYPPGEMESLEDHRTAAFARFPVALRERLGTDDPQKYLDYYLTHRSWLAPGEGRSWEVDEDAKALGIANSDVALLERAAKDWTDGTEVERAQRLLKRYTDQTFLTPEAASDWLVKHKGRLFFSDVGGFRFFVAPGAELTPESKAAPDPPTDDNPVVPSIEVTPRTVRPGETVTLRLSVSLAPGWHLYGNVPKGQPYKQAIPVLEGTGALKAMGSWEHPVGRPDPKAPGLTLLENDLVFLHEISVPKGATPGTETVKVSFSWQACDETMCLPPQTVELEAELTVAVR